MAVNVKTGTVAGVDIFYAGTVDDSGNLTGGTGTLPVAGDTNGSGMIRVEGITNFPTSVVTPEAVTVMGDNRPLSQFLFEPGEFGSNEMRFGTEDLPFGALVESTLVEDVAGWSWAPIQPKNPIYRQMCYIVQSNSFARDTAVLNNAEWYINYILKVQTAPLHRAEFALRAAGDFGYNNVLNEAAQTPWGVAFTDIANGTTAMVAMKTFSQYPVHQHVFVGDAIETDFILDQTPIDSADWMTVAVNGVVQVYTTAYTITAATKTVAFVAAPADAALIEIFYGFVI